MGVEKYGALRSQPIDRRRDRDVVSIATKQRLQVIDRDEQDIGLNLIGMKARLGHASRRYDPRQQTANQNQRRDCLDEISSDCFTPQTAILFKV